MQAAFASRPAALTALDRRLLTHTAMPSPLALFASVALVLPMIGLGAVQGEDFGQGEARVSSAPDYELPAEGPYSPAKGAGANPLDAFHGGQTWGQVRIEQRVIIRISPQRQTNRNNLLASLPPRGLNTRFVEQEMDECVPLSRISGVQTGNGSRLLLYLSDSRVVSLNLERACRARDFYSGFYVERTEDGQLCASRDELQSRSGAKCEVETMRQLVAVED